MGNTVNIRTTLDGAQQVGAGLKGIKAEASGLGSSFGGIGTAAEKGLGKVGGAVSHAKSQLLGLGKSIAPLLGVAGFAGLGAVIGSSLGKATEFGVGVSKVASLTGLASDQASALVDALDKYGISADKQVTLFGKQEKGLSTLVGMTGKGKDAVSKAAKFTKDYGLSITDTNGKLLDANALLLRSADYFNGSATASQKAAALSKLYGKTWTDLIPVLQLGSKGIKQQEADAIHLTSTQLANISKFKEAQRDFADTVGDLQVKIGAELMPTITGALKEVGGWLDTHSDDVVKFFHDAAQFGGQLAQGAKAAFGAIKAGWDAVPGPLKQLLIGGFAAGKVTKFLFGVDVTASIAKGIGGAISGAIGKSVSSAVVAAGIGKAFVQPVFVTNPGFGTGPVKDVVKDAVDTVKPAIPALGAGSLAAGAGLVTLGAVVSGLSMMEAGAKNQIISNKYGGLNEKQISAVKYYQGSDEFQRQFFKHMGYIPSKADYEAAIAHGTSPIVQATGSASAQAHADALAGSPAEIAAIGDLRKSLDLRAKAREVAPTQQLAFIGTHTNTGAVTVANAIADKFAKVQTPYYRSQQNAERALKKLEGLQQRFLDHGDTKSAAAIGKDIAAMKKVLATAVGGTTSAVNNVNATLGKIGDFGAYHPGSTNAGSAGGVPQPLGHHTPTAVQGSQNVREHASGLLGMTSGATSLGIAGEAGSEAVAILRNPRPISGGGGAVTINLNVHSSTGIITPGAARDIMRELGPLLVQWMQRNGLVARVGTPLRG